MFTTFIAILVSATAAVAVVEPLILRRWLGNCDFDFFNFGHRQVRNFEILNQFERNQNFAVIFRKYRKQNWKSTKYYAISWKSSVIPLKFREMSLVLWNLINYC